MSTTPPDRDTLRSELRQRRRELPANARIAAADALAHNLSGSALLPEQGYVAGYWANDGEIGLHVVQMRLPQPLVYCLPILHTDRTLRFAPWCAGDPLVINRFGIPEPAVTPDSALPASEMAMIILPLVGFDAAGNRLGMGGGWYDRSLAFRTTTNTAPRLVGAAFDCQKVDAVAPQPWDVRLDAVCTERAIYPSKKIA